MKKILIILSLLIVLTSCSTYDNWKLVCDKILTDLTYGWYGSMQCITQETYLSIIKYKCRDNINESNCVQDYLDIKWIDLKINK